jgi:galactokinase
MAKASPPNGAINLLKSDHRAVEELFEKFEKSRSGKEGIAKTICLELIIHTMIEEEIFYPACKGQIEDEELLEEAHVEHDGAKMLISEILAGSPNDEFYDAKVKVLSEMIKHHVKEEEQRDGLFAQAREAEIDLDELGQRMKARKDELKKQFERTGPPTPVTRTMKGAKVEMGKPVA